MDGPIATLNVTIDKKEALLDMAKSNIEKIDEVGDFLFTLMQKVENSTIWNKHANVHKRRRQFFEIFDLPPRFVIISL